MLSFFLWFLFLSSCESLDIPSRRILHEPFLPSDDSSSSSSPPPPPLTPDSPFFPAFTASPPPPSPSTFASFPANISSLVLPRTPTPNRNSQKLLILAIAAVISASIVALLLLFFYCRRRSLKRNSLDDTKTSTSENSSRLYPNNNNNNNVDARKLRTTSTTSSEFLYFGTLVNARGGNGGNTNNSPGNARSDTRKMDSPDLQPLPPLSRQNTSRNIRDYEVEFVTEEEEEEEQFYSPSGSLGGRLSSNETGSASRRLFAVKSVESSSTGSSSSSTSGSPARSQSLSISPPVSLSPRRSDPKTPERILVDSPRVSNALIGNIPSPLQSPMFVSDRNMGSPSLSSAATSPNRALIEKLDASIRNFKDLVQNMGNPLNSASSKEIPQETKSPSVCSASTSSVSLSPERAFEKSPDMSPLMVGFSDYNKASSPSPSSSLASSSPGRDLERSPIPSPVRISRALKNPILTPLLPPPPPPPPKQRRLWEKPVSSVSFAHQISKPPPPPLMPPSMPFMTQNPIKISPVPTRLVSKTVEDAEEEDEASKPKLKPLHWDKVRASSDRVMVWDHLRSSSFKLNEEMIETLFVVNTQNSKPKQTTPPSVLPSPNQENRVLDPKKAQNIAILLRALNVTVEEVCEALLEGNADTLGTELLESLLKMAPTKEEERKLKEYKDDSPVKLGPAEKFLKAVLDIPFAFKRVDALLYLANFESEVDYLKMSFKTLEAACEELRNSRMFLKLLEAVLKTGNRMNVGTNRGDAHAFKLDTLLKLVDVKGADGKTTLLHFVVQEIRRTEGSRLSNTNQIPNSTSNEDSRCRKLGLQVVSGLSSELSNVKKAAAMDSEVLGCDVAKLSKGLENISEALRSNEMMDESREKFSESMNRFMKIAEEEIIRIQAHESVALSLVKEITEYFHGNSAKEEAHPFRIFLVVRDFLTVLDRVCKEVGMINERTSFSSVHKFPVPVNPMMQQAFPVPVNPMLMRAFPGFHGRPQYGSDDET